MLVRDELAAAVADAGVEDVAVLLVRHHGPGRAARVVALFVAGGGVVSLEFSQVQYLIRGGGEEIMSRGVHEPIFWARAEPRQICVSQARAKLALEPKIEQSQRAEIRAKAENRNSSYEGKNSTKPYFFTIF